MVQDICQRNFLNSGPVGKGSAAATTAAADGGGGGGDGGVHLSR